MLRSILIGIDGTPSGRAAQATGLALAGQLGASVTGVGIVDTVWITRPEPVPIGGAAFKAHKEQLALDEARQEAGSALDGCRALAASAGVPVSLQVLEGDPVAELEAASVNHDLIVVGREAADHDDRHKGLSKAAAELVRHNPRPLLVTPEKPTDLNRVLVAFDGSIPSSRAVHMFGLLGLAAGRAVQVVTVGEFQTGAEALAGRAAELLRRHGAVTEALGIGSDATPHEILVSHAQAWEAGLIVMGAFGHSGLHELVFGSATRRMVAECPTSLFIHH